MGKPDYNKLLHFYNEIIQKTLHHDVINGSACVSVKSISDSLEKVDKEWWQLRLDDPNSRGI